MVSRGGASSVRWRGDGKELLYVADGAMMSVDVHTSPGSPVFDADTPKVLFKEGTVSVAGGLYWDVSQDGNRFLLPFVQAAGTQNAPTASLQPYKVVLNWTALMKK
jgi:hypothetical protein